MVTKNKSLKPLEKSRLSENVIPAKAGICKRLFSLDSHFHGNDKKRVFGQPAIALFVALLLGGFLAPQHTRAELYWAPPERVGPEVIGVEKERWEGFDTYDGYFWMYQAVRWPRSVLDNIENDSLVNEKDLSAVYEFRRGAEDGERWEHWDGVWAHMKTDWFLFIPTRYYREVFTEYVTSLPGADNKGTEETDDWFGKRVDVGYDTVRGALGWLITGSPWGALAGVDVYPPISWGFDLCDQMEPLKSPGNWCDEEYEIGVDWKRLEADRYYYAAIKFRTDAGEETQKVDWYVNFQFEEKKEILGNHVPGYYENHYNCNTDRGSWSLEYSSLPRKKDEILSSPIENDKICTDFDGDGKPDGTGNPDKKDNCPEVANLDQADYDGDEIGDICDPCPRDPANDADGDGWCACGPGDAADACDKFSSDSSNDADGDGIAGAIDNCPNVSNADQKDTDRDGMGDVCDNDDDNDGHPDTNDAFPLDAEEWSDTDHDGIGNNNDIDDDGDGYPDLIETSLGSDPLDNLSNPRDTDGDKIPDLIDSDDDNDGVPDHLDAFPLNPAEWMDTDGDGIGNNADNDDDGDGYPDTVELGERSDPLNSFSIPADFDRDFIPDSIDLDDDNDGYHDNNDAFPKDASEWLDTDGDGIGNNADRDDDNDGYSDLTEQGCGSNPLDRASTPADYDRDYNPDLFDTDDDNDGYLDDNDAFPQNSMEWLDTDGDSIGDNADTDDDGDGYSDSVELNEASSSKNASETPADFDHDLLPDRTDPDDDNDGVLDRSDAFPKNAAEQDDTDRDGIGDNADTDDDNDGYSDTDETAAGSNPKNPYSRPADNDRDGIPDGTDTDDDNDGILDEDDAFPFNAAESVDTDSDGVGDNRDADDDNDLYVDNIEIQVGTDPLDAQSKPADHDEDLIPDVLDLDDDNDGVPDIEDLFPYDPVESVDTDGDGIGDNADTDDDNDGYPDPVEISEGSNHLDASSTPLDTDHDFIPNSTDPDDDNDGHLDGDDAFPTDLAEWLDTDRDGIGNNADTDDDGDGYSDDVEDAENTDPLNPASVPADFDHDFIPDSTDPDIDNDGYLNADDAFDYDAGEWLDTDGDGIGNNRDIDNDNDGYTDSAESSCGSDSLSSSSKPADYDGDKNPDCLDTDDDNDGHADSGDACPKDARDWIDTDGDGTCNYADSDDDGDGYSDDAESQCGSQPLNSNSKPADYDGDKNPDCLDTDDDNDGHADSSDACPKDANDWVDTDGDGTCNYADSDDDGDGYSDDAETQCGSQPLNPNSKPADYDGDKNPDCLDTDDDNDNHPDSSDACPKDATDWIDTDGDGVCNASDNDDDGDGYADSAETSCGGDPLSSSSKPADYDGDKNPDCLDTDDDDDGHPDSSDACPKDANDWVDTDGDGTCNYADADDDGDGMPDTWENQYGLDPLVWNSSSDKDSDRFTNGEECDSKTDPTNASSYPPFCGSSTYAACSTESNCNTGGCSGQICKHVNQSKVSTCDWRTCYDESIYGLACGCYNNQCQWGIPLRTELYRLYNSRSSDHFYTTSSSERDSAMANSGYSYEWIVGKVFTNKAQGTGPLYRLYNGGQHFYTINSNERDSVVRSGWTDEGITGYVYLTQQSGTIPLYRLSNGGRHLYTTNSSERDSVVRDGWTDEGITGYLFP